MGSVSDGGVVLGHLGREGGCSPLGVGSAFWGAVGGLSCGPALRPVLGPVALGHGRHQVDASQAGIGDLLTDRRALNGLEVVQFLLQFSHQPARDDDL